MCYHSDFNNFLGNSYLRPFERTGDLQDIDRVPDSIEALTRFVSFIEFPLSD